MRRYAGRVLHNRRILGCVLTAAAVGAVLFPSEVPAAAPGSRDTSFGTNGISRVGTVRQGAVTRTRWANGVGIVRQPGGRLVAAMTFFHPVIRSGRLFSATREITP